MYRNPNKLNNNILKKKSKRDLMPNLGTYLIWEWLQYPARSQPCTKQ